MLTLGDMGEELIYQYKKMIPHFVLAFSAVIVMFAVISVIFSSYVGTVWLWSVFGLLFGSLFFFLGIEYYRSTHLVKGNIDGIPISDLTKAIYWLSIINSGAASFYLGGINYYQNVSKVLSRIGGEAETKWQSVTRRHRMPETRGLYALVIVAILAMLSMFLTFAFFRNLEILAVVIMVIIAFVVLREAGNQFRMGAIIAQDPQTVEVTDYLIKKMVSWISAKTHEPIRVVLGGKTVEGAEAVDSLQSYIIAEIKPKGTMSRSPSETQFFVSSEKEKWRVRRIERSERNLRVLYLSLHIAVGTICGFLVFAFSKRLLSGKADALDIVAMAGVIGLFALGQFFLYIYIPLMKVLFQGGKAASSDLEMIAKRFENSRLQRLSATDPEFRQRIWFFITLERDKSADFSTVEEPIKLWIKKEAEQPSAFKYLKLDGNIVTLTAKGETLAKTLEKKMKTKSPSV